MILKIIIWSIVLTMVFRFVFRFVLPIFRITTMAQSRMRQMQQQMDDMQKRTNADNQPKPKVKVEGDYIEYEEIKEKR